MASCRATTLALVADKGMDRSTYVDLSTDHLTGQGVTYADNFRAGAHVAIELTKDKAGHEFTELEM